MAELRTDKARQGRSGRPVLFVLIGGLVLALIVFAGLGIFNSTQPDQNIGGAANSGVNTAPATVTGSASTTVTPGQSNAGGATTGTAPN